MKVDIRNEQNVLQTRFILNSAFFLLITTVFFIDKPMPIILFYLKLFAFLFVSFFSFFLFYQVMTLVSVSSKYWEKPEQI